MLGVAVLGLIITSWPYLLALAGFWHLPVAWRISLDGYPGAIAAAFSPDETRLAILEEVAVCSDSPEFGTHRFVSLIESHSGRNVYKREIGHVRLVALCGGIFGRYTQPNLGNAVMFSPDGRLLAAEAADEGALKVTVLDAETGDTVATFRHQGELCRNAFSADGSWLYLIRSDFETDELVIGVWDTTAWTQIRSSRIPKKRVYDEIALVPADSSVVRASFHEQDFRSWDPSTGVERLDRRRNFDPPFELVSYQADPLHGKQPPAGPSDLSPDGSLFFVGGRLWDLRAERVQASLEGMNFENTQGIGFSGDSRVVAAVGEAEGRSTLDRMPVAFQRWLTKLGFASAGRTTRREVRLWRASSGRALGKVMRTPDYVSLLAISRDATLLATHEKDKVVVRKLYLEH